MRPRAGRLTWAPPQPCAREQPRHERGRQAVRRASRALNDPKLNLRVSVTGHVSSSMAETPCQHSAPLCASPDREPEVDVVAEYRAVVEGQGCHRRLSVRAAHACRSARTATRKMRQKPWTARRRMRAAGYAPSGPGAPACFPATWGLRRRPQPNSSSAALDAATGNTKWDHRTTLYTYPSLQYAVVRRWRVVALL